VTKLATDPSFVYAGAALRQSLEAVADETRPAAGDGTRVSWRLETAARELPAARARMQDAVRLALADGCVLSYGGETARVLSTVEYALATAENSGDFRTYGEALAMLAHLSALPGTCTDLASAKMISRAFEKWRHHAFGAGVSTPADVFSLPPADARRMRIVATLDPRADDAALEALVAAGMNVARLNAAHGDADILKDVISRARNAASKAGRDLKVQIDLSGPKIRLGKFENPTNAKFNDIHLKLGDTVRLTTKEVLGNPKLLPVDYPPLGDDLKIGQTICLNDGTVLLTCTKIEKHDDGTATVEAVVKLGGKVWDRKGINLPDSKLSVPTISDDDKRALSSLIQDVDLVAMSFVRSAADVLELRELMRKEGKVVPIISKIERQEAIDALDAITEVSDALMVARGDLGVELGFQNVPTAEKKIIEAAKMHGKPVMVATEAMMTLLQNAARPSRGEAMGLHSAIAAGADAIMLGKETSASPTPGQVVSTVAELVRTVERQITEEAFAQAKISTKVASASMSMTTLRTRTHEA
jgi:pyruvate kinase